MRISAKHPQGNLVEVFMDDVKLTNCIEACTEENWAIVQVLDADGRVRVNGAEIMTEKVHGRIEFNLPDGFVE